MTLRHKSGESIRERAEEAEGASHGMTLRGQVETRRDEWEAFNRWEEEQPRGVRDPEAAMADIGWLWRLVPPEFRLVDPDPEREGLRAWRAALEKVFGPK